MTACPTCSGYGMRHDPIAHGAEPTWVDCRTCLGGGSIRDTADLECDVPGLRGRWGVGAVSEPECTCDERRFTVCHDIRNEPHLAGCPRWGAPKRVIRLHMVYPDGTHTTDCKGCQP